MWANKNNNFGFTIVETLIVLAVSGALFISVALLIQGRIESGRVRDAAISLEASVNGILNDVATGYYPITGSGFSCTPGTPPTVITSGADNRGTQNGCIIAGKKIVFGADNIIVSTLVGSASLPSLPSDANTYFSSVPGLDENIPYKWKINPVLTGQELYLLYGNYAPATGGDGEFSSGAQSVSIYETPSSLTKIGALGKVICFNNGTKKTKLTLGVGGAPTAIVDIDAAGDGC